MEKSNKTRHWKLMRAQGKAKKGIEEGCIIIQWKHCINSLRKLLCQKGFIAVWAARRPSTVGAFNYYICFCCWWYRHVFVLRNLSRPLFYWLWGYTIKFAFFRISLLKTFYHLKYLYSVFSIFWKMASTNVCNWTITKTAKLVPSRLWMS